ncbi:MAG: hypothetical protein L0Y50_00450 [Beijerinckiaceae bacterium]|nr:hypothetical protein [Beijerinckiaceae bacterium]MCI0734742.1 hypothetical protein [Beijerinckiaceae bacterium]
MMARPVAHYLVRFEPPGSAASRGDASRGNEAPDLPEEISNDDLALSVRAAREEAFAEGLATAGREYEARLAGERQEFESRLAALRDNCLRQESEKLSQKIQAALDMAESNIAGSVARILRPFVNDAVRRKTVDQLAENVGVLLRGRERPFIEIRGPEDLLAKLRETLSSSTAAIDYCPDDTIDVQVVSGETMIESQLAAWAARIGTSEE